MSARVSDRLVIREAPHAFIGLGRNPARAVELGQYLLCMRERDPEAYSVDWFLTPDAALAPAPAPMDTEALELGRVLITRYGTNKRTRARHSRGKR